jgi:hypothetical protein
MARDKRPPSASRLRRSSVNAFARRSRTQGGATDDDTEDTTDLPPVKPAASEVGTKDAKPAADKTASKTAPPDGETHEALDQSDLPTGPLVMTEASAPTLPVSPVTAPPGAVLSSPPPMPTEPPPMPAPEVPSAATSAEAAAAAARRAADELLPDPRAIPTGDPDDPAPPPGEVPRGDSRSMRRGGEFVLVYRKRNVVVTRFGAVGRRGQWRVVEYPTPGYAANAFAREVSRWVADGYSDFRDA